MPDDKKRSTDMTTKQMLSGIPQAGIYSAPAGPVVSGGGTALMAYMLKNRQNQRNMPQLRRGLVPPASKMPRRPLEQTDEVFDVNEVDPSKLPVPGGSADLNARLLAVRNQQDNEAAVRADIEKQMETMREYAEEIPIMKEADKYSTETVKRSQGHDWHSIIKSALESQINERNAAAEKAAKEPQK